MIRMPLLQGIWDHEHRQDTPNHRLRVTGMRRPTFTWPLCCRHQGPRAPSYFLIRDKTRAGLIYNTLLPALFCHDATEITCSMEFSLYWFGPVGTSLSRVEANHEWISSIRVEWIRNKSLLQIHSFGTLKFLNRQADTSGVMNNEVSTATAIQAEETTARDGEILTVVEVARFLRVPKSTVYKLARVGELPASKIGKHWRFLRRDIHEWMRGRSRPG